jgi:protein-S-isoprenylcysteine O-methyltransferase Ste14
VRLYVLMILLSLLVISGIYRNKARQEGGVIKRQEEGWLAAITRIGFALPLLIVLLLNIFFPPVMRWAKFNLPEIIQVAGLILGFISVPFLWWVFLNIGKNISETVLVKDQHELITSGPYRWIRHPLYAGALLLLGAVSLIFQDLVILGYVVVGILAFRLLVIPAEEERLLEAFGEDYECYRRRTGTLLPWIR